MRAFIVVLLFVLCGSLYALDWATYPQPFYTGDVKIEQKPQRYIYNKFNWQKDCVVFGSASFYMYVASLSANHFMRTGSGVDLLICIGSAYGFRTTFRYAKINFYFITD